jgi:hypothetical protein
VAIVLSGVPVTLIAGMVCDDGSLVLCGDSQLTDSDGTRLTDALKLGTLPDRPVAWGWSGDETIARDWGTWFQGADHSWPSWSELRESATEELSRLNGRRRHLNELSGVKTTDNDVTTILLAGFVGGVPHLIELSERGGAMPATHHSVAAIGSGSPHFKIAFRTLCVFYRGKPVPLTEDHMVHLMLAAIQVNLTGCGFPIRLVKVTPEGASEIGTVQTTPA